MANVTRYSPTSGAIPLGEAMNRLFQEAFTWPSLAANGTGQFAAPSNWTIPSNLFENDNGYLLQVALPGVAPDKLQITAQGNVLYLKGTFSVQAPDGSKGLWASMPAGDFGY